MGLSKAFDSISHDVLRKKLKTIGFYTDAQNLITNFHIHPCKKLDSSYSNWIKVVKVYPKEPYWDLFF